MRVNMQDKYTADITDFFKFLLLRNIEKETGLRIGINWCVPTEKVVDTESDKDGKKKNWITEEEYKNLDPELFTKLKGLIEKNQISISSLESLDLFRKGASYFSDPIPHVEGNPDLSLKKRKEWISKSLSVLQTSEIIFLDPDNGFKESNKKQSSKHIYSSEIKELYRSGKSIILINFRDRSPQDRYTDKLYSIAYEIGEPIPIYTMRNRVHGFRDFIIIPRKEHLDQFEKFFRAHKENETLKKYYEHIGISSGKFFTRDTFYLVPYKEEINKRRFSEEEQQQFDSFYDDDFGDIEVGFYEKKLSKLIEDVIEIEGLNLGEKQQEELEYHILKAIKLFTARIQFG